MASVTPVSADIVIDAMQAEDWPAVARIYQAGIDAGDATFEVAPPRWEAFDAGRRPAPRLVARQGTEVVGWVAVTSVSAREVYAGVVEHSVFVDPASHGRGIGGQLLSAMIAAAEEAGIWTIQAQVFP